MYSTEVSRNTFLKKLNYNILKNIILILDCEERWVQLACVIPLIYPHPHIGLEPDEIRKLKNSPSPTRDLIEYWCTQNATVNDLIQALTQADQIRTANYLAVDILKEQPVSLPCTGPSAPIPIGNHVLSTNTQGHVNPPKSSEVNPLLNVNTEIDGLESSSIQHLLFKDLQAATDNFNRKCLIGEGSFGSVYYCRLTDDKEVAIKLLKENTTKQFESEINVLSRFKHENLVPLVGYSCNVFDCCLIYEYMKNGNLHDRLHCINNTKPLPWKLRFLIAEGITRAISYLHTAEPMPYIHRDIKSTNILLDKNFVAKVGDFGLSRVISSNSTEMTTVACGTSAYMPREASFGYITVKLDTFAFGVVLFELLTGLRVFDENREERDLLSHILDNCEKSIMPLLDTKAGDWPQVLTDQLYDIAVKCSEENRKRRPVMVEILPDIEKLCEELESFCQVEPDI